MEELQNLWNDPWVVSELSAEGQTMARQVPPSNRESHFLKEMQILLKKCTNTQKIELLQSPNIIIRFEQLCELAPTKKTFCKKIVAVDAI
jgi:hypothetical protein